MHLLPFTITIYIEVFNVKLGKLFIISACSGAGKTTLVNAVLESLHDDIPSLSRVITYTTKKMRPGEIEGRDYYFITPELFEKKREQGFFLEWSKAYGFYYGSPRHVMDDIKKGFSRVLILDRAGARRVLDELPQSVLIWIYTVNHQILRERLKKRAADSEDQIKKRLEIAYKEIKQEQENSFYHYHLLNDQFSDALEQLKGVILKES